MHWTARRRFCFDLDIIGPPPVMSKVGWMQNMRTALNITKFVVAAALFGFGVVISAAAAFWRFEECGSVVSNQFSKRS